MTTSLAARLAAASTLATSLVTPVAGAAPRYSEIAETTLPSTPALSSSPASIDEGAVSWMQVTGVGAVVPAKRPARGGKAPGKPPVVTYDNNQLVTTDGCLRVLTPGRENESVEMTYVSLPEAVVPVQHERVVSDGKGGARLEIAQAWLDVRTRQSRTIVETSAPLVRLLPTMNGLETWGLRESTGLRVVVSDAPEAVGDRRGMIYRQTCSLVWLTVRNEAQGSQAVIDISRMYYDRISPTEPQLTTFGRTLRLTASLSRLSRDPEPVLSVGLRFSDNMPLPPRIEPAPAAP